MEAQFAEFTDTESRHSAFWSALPGAFGMAKYPMADAEVIGKRIRFLADFTGKSYTAFAEHADVSPSRIGNALKGLNRIGLEDAISICRTYHVTLDWIYIGRRDFLPKAFADALDAAGFEH